MWRRKEDSTDAYGRGSARKEEKPFPRYRQSYERYFEGYTVKNTVSPSGKNVPIRVYTGARYRPDLSDAQLRKNKLLGIVFLLASVALALFSLSLQAESNYDVVAFVFACLPVVSCVVALYAQHVCYGADGELKLYEYKSGAQHLVWFSLASAAAFGVSVLVSMLLLLIRHRAFTGQEGLRLLLQAIGGVLCLLLWRQERSVTYTLLPGEDEAEI